MRKLEAIKYILLGIWSVSIFTRLVGKLTNLYEIPKWSIYLTLVSLILWTTLSLTMYFIKKMKKLFALLLADLDQEFFDKVFGKDAVTSVTCICFVASPRH